MNTPRSSIQKWLTTKKIKKGGYTVTLEYEIGTDGVVSTKNIICDPKSEALDESYQ